MSPWIAALALLLGWGTFLVQLRLRWRLLLAQAPRRSVRLANLGPRVSRLLLEGFGQKKLYLYPQAGFAHHLLFLGFLVLLPQTLMLWGRGFKPDCHLFFLQPNAADPWCWGSLYFGLREYATLLVLGAVGYFAYVRVVRRPKRLTLSREGALILVLIATMMAADLLYEACGMSLAGRLALDGRPLALNDSLLAQFSAPFVGVSSGLVAWRAPGSALVLPLFRGCSDDLLLGYGLLGYALHGLLVLVFLNLLPRTKHLHVITALPNLFLAEPQAGGGSRVLAPSSEALLEHVEAAVCEDRLDAAGIGYGRVEHFGFKTRLDWISCTECGRCSEHCPATRTGKPLDPKALTLSLKGQLQKAAPRLLSERRPFDSTGEVSATVAANEPVLVAKEVFWACTTCRACEEQCPVAIRYVDTIIGLRQNAVLMQGQVPPELHRVFEGLERQGNPWNFPRAERDAWAKELAVPRLKDERQVDVLYWVGCMASYDARARNAATAFVWLMRQAGIRFAILGNEEQCTGDAARRAGNELLFLQLAERNIARLNAYQAEGRFATIVATCPHCLVTLKEDYRALGGQYEVCSHLEALERWCGEGRLAKPEALGLSVAYHDPCTLARQAGILTTPRRLLEHTLGCELRLPQHHGKHTLCCGAGGAQMWLEEQNQERMNVERARELLATAAAQVVSACPFCLSMLKDGCDSDRVKDEAQRPPRVLDVAELFAQALKGSGPGSRDGQSA